MADPTLYLFDGFNVYPMEIENCLQQHPLVVEAIAFPLASERLGDIPLAAVRISAAVTEAELMNALSHPGGAA